MVEKMFNNFLDEITPFEHTLARLKNSKDDLLDTMSENIVPTEQGQNLVSRMIEIKTLVEELSVKIAVLDQEIVNGLVEPLPDEAKRLREYREQDQLIKKVIPLVFAANFIAN